MQCVLCVYRGNKGSLFILQKTQPDDEDANWAALNLKQSSVSSATSAKSGRKKVCIILPAQLASTKDYAQLKESLLAEFGLDSVTTPLSFTDWIVRNSFINILLYMYLMCVCAWLGRVVALIRNEGVPSRYVAAEQNPSLLHGEGAAAYLHTH